jgi:ribosomal protein S18 acetylase RimI-like enzyme
MPRINVTGGYVPGAIGTIVALHAKHYAAGPDFVLAYEAEIATELSSFLAGMNPDHDLLLIASVHGMIVGSLSVDSRTSRPGEAQLRWLVAHPLYSPSEVYSALVREALEFCSRRNYTRIVLLTYANSDVVRRLAADWGFHLVGEIESRDWHAPIRQQIFELVA